MAVEIRQASAADDVAARDIVEEYCRAIGVVVRDDPATLRSYLEGPGALWLACDGDAVVGCVVLRPLPALAADACEVKRLYVSPARRGERIAGRLMDALEQYARQAGYRAVYLDTYDELAVAIRLYERRGYEPTARYNDNPQATQFLRLALVEEP